MKATNLLEKKLSPLNFLSARVILISHLLTGIIKHQTVNLVKLANYFDTDAQVESNYKRIQRFFKSYKIDFDKMACLIATWLPKNKWLLCLDRTNWKIGKTDVNILVLAVAYKGIAIPILWELLDKKGNSNTDERIALIDRFIRLFGCEKIKCLTGDREFRGKEWLKYLVDKKVPFRLRVLNNTKVSNRWNTEKVSVTRLFPIKVNEKMCLRKPRQLWGSTVYLGATRTKDGYVIIISNVYTTDILEDYAQRWEIETLFGCLKTRGFDME
ncbi:MAG: IS4 family transposase, partial [Pseudomonadota bacterium]